MVRNFEITLPVFPRGFHIITDLVIESLPELPESGMLHVFIRHTSAGIAINENADPSVLTDFNRTFDVLVPENSPHYTHTLEGSDDMPAHIKAVMTGSTVSIPIIQGRLALGTWQGIYLCEFRNRGGHRKLIASIID